MCKVFLWSWAEKTKLQSFLVWLSSGRQRAPLRDGREMGRREMVPDPERVYLELEGFRTDSPFVFAAFSDQLRSFHASSSQPWQASQVRAQFDPENLGEWFYRQVSLWSESLVRGKAYVHVFRKTSLQYARRGDDANARLANDARVGKGVMLTSYVKESDEEMRHSSSRMFARIRSSLRPDVALRYGYDEPMTSPLEQQLNEAIAAQDWQLATRLTAQLAQQKNRAS